MIKDQYDAIVVGAGPAGAVAARRLAEGGLDVLLIEKRQEIGAPVRCGEAVGEHLTQPYIAVTPAPRWVDARITAYSIHGAGGDSVRVGMNWTTLIVNRKVFDLELAHLAANAGARVMARTQAEGLTREGGAIRVNMMCLGRACAARARLVIAADGTESQVARWAGLKTVPPMGEYYVGAQYLLSGLEIDPALTEYHFGEGLAPGGYVWVFPKGKDTANVGLIIGADKARAVSAQAWLDQFVGRRFPNAQNLGVVVGGIPATGGISRMTADGVMAVGDAAHQVDPLIAGGINLGMIGAEMAAQTALDAFATGDLSASGLAGYDMAWKKRFGGQQRALKDARKALNKVSDADFGAAVRLAARKPPQGVPMQAVVMGWLGTNATLAGPLH